ncbi:MAG: helix-turn-helix transcriptional regulator [Eubacteriales bacterium]|nr:helix-turn-helix transcriptional regulator [Eubacteriales bacterium]
MVENLKKLRQEKGASQQEVGDYAGLSQQTINRYENHKIEPDIGTLKKFANYFETSIDYLVGHTGIRHIIEPVEECDLNKEELVLLEKYRRLSRKSRKNILSVIDDLLAKK